MKNKETLFTTETTFKQVNIHTYTCVPVCYWYWQQSPKLLTQLQLHFSVMFITFCVHRIQESKRMHVMKFLIAINYFNHD